MYKKQTTYINNIKKKNGVIVSSCTFPPYRINKDFKLKDIEGKVITLYDDCAIVENIYKFKVINYYVKM